MAEGRSQGYDAIFVPEVDKKYTCPVCLAVLRDAVQTHCGHRFCEVCIINVIGDEHAARCPVDNTWFYADSQLFEDVAIRREILSFSVRCYYLNDGCTWKSELRDYEEHIEDCIYRPVPCTHQCGISVLYLNLSEHLDLCPRRPTICPHCEENIIHVDMTKHQLLFCQKFPVSCTLCCKTGILRENIPKHLHLKTGDCPNTTISCSFLSVGCHFMDRRSLMSNHYAENIEEHVSLLLSKSMSRDTQIERGLSDIVKTHDEINNLNFVVLSQKREIEELRQRIEMLQKENRTGCFHWKVCLPESTHEQSSITSQSIYTGVPGYRLHFTLNFDVQDSNPDLFGSVYLYCYLQSGEYDEQMLFPFYLSVKVTIFDQFHSKASRVNFTKCFDCKLTSPVPSTENYTPSSSSTDTTARVCAKEKLMGKNSFYSTQYKKNGQVFMKIEVSST